MKKSVKLLSIATAIVAMSLAILQTSAHEVKLEILEWTSTCTWSDYDFSGYDVSASQIDLNAVTHNVNCVLLNSAAGNVTLQLPQNLKSAQNQTIPATGFTFTTAAWTTNGTLHDDVAETNAIEFSTQARVMYAKTQYEVWELTNLPLTLDGVVPWGTPAWVYTWELNITFWA